MTLVEARTPDGKLIDLTEVSLSQSQRIMITDDQGHQVYIHSAAWLGVVKAVSTLLHAQNTGLARDILAIRGRAQLEIDTSWETRWPAILDRALDDIIDRCNESLTQEE